jgi:4-diphosphocytidyl-2-C-methyl-D-erythritol kinase
MTAGSSALAARAPAKLNLGLEIIGKRPDGYHELATIFVAVRPEDDLAIARAETASLLVDDPNLAGDDNLALRALHLLAAHAGIAPNAAIELRKRIPAAAGLGGASSDAAAVLRLARDLWRLPTPDADLANLAARLGSDVPFFRRGGCALGSGRGEVLAPLPMPSDAWFVLVAPAIAIPRKTATLYGAIRPSDYSDGTRILAQGQRLEHGQPLDPALLGNAFERPLHGLRPDLSELPPLMRRLGAPVVALSGAGPTHYAVLDDQAAAAALAARLRDALGDRARVFASPPLPPVR